MIFETAGFKVSKSFSGNRRTMWLLYCRNALSSRVPRRGSKCVNDVRLNDPGHPIMPSASSLRSFVGLLYGARAYRNMQTGCAALADTVAGYRIGG